MFSIKILIVDDEIRIQELLKAYLLKENYSIEVASDGEQALDMIKKKDFDLYILDVMLPILDGFSLCREIRAKSDKPVIMLTARGEEHERILGFELGADDYVVKPFSPREMVARVKALLKRSVFQEKVEGESMSFPNLLISLSSRSVQANEKLVTLTPKEFELLVYLAKSPGRVFTREQILENVWDLNYFGDLRTVDTHIKKLREKLGLVGEKYINTVWGVGYKFEVK